MTLVGVGIKLYKFNVCGGRMEGKIEPMGSEAQSGKI